ncbi:MAG: DoxX family protein [Gemmatimonadaceae bacterium]|nr:DoxX family protein [Gemmatimonadaceae bacterium]
MSSSLTSMRVPDRWLAVLRIVVGLWFVKSLFTKMTIVLAWGFLPVPAANHRWIGVMPKLLARYAADNPIDWYRSFLLDTVIPNSHVFAHLTALGEVAVGLSLTLGVVTVLGAFFGFFQVLFYAFAVQHMSSGQQGFHVMLGAMMIAFFFARAGRCWGIDRWLVRRYPRSFWTAVG